MSPFTENSIIYLQFSIQEDLTLSKLLTKKLKLFRVFFLRRESLAYVFTSGEHGSMKWRKAKDITLSQISAHFKQAFGHF